MSSPFDKAREHFRAAIAKHYPTLVQDGTRALPVREVDTEPYGPLLTGSHYAFMTEWQPGKTGPRGFADPEGRVFLATDKASLGWFLIDACRVGDSAKSLSALAVARRLAWAYHGFGEVIENAKDHPFAVGAHMDLVKPPSIERGAGKTTVTYWALSGGDGGAEMVSRIQIVVGNDKQASLVRKHLAELVK